MTNLLEKHNIEIRRAITKYKHTHTAFVEAFNKELAKLLFKLMDAQELQDPGKVSNDLGQKFESDCEQNEQHKIVDEWYET